MAESLESGESMVAAHAALAHAAEGHGAGGQVDDGVVDIYASVFYGREHRTWR